MIRVKKLILENYCGYKNCQFNFVKKDGSIKNFVALYAPNGAGKSTCLNAINLLGSAHRLQNNDTDMLFRKTVYNQDYDPVYASYQKKNERIMKISGMFHTDEGDKQVILSSEQKRGVILNELPKKFGGAVYFLDADNPINLSKFQLNEKCHQKFLRISKDIYDYPVSLNKAQTALELQGQIDNSFEKNESDNSPKFHSDVMIQKDDVTVHFKSMSAGEKKLSTLISSMCMEQLNGNSDIWLIDNIELHIYFKRHPKLVDALIREFPNKQFIVTTHSGILVGTDGVKGYLTDQQKMDVFEIKKGNING